MPLSLERVAARFRHADLSLFFDFVPPPYGGGNQFLHALRRELGRRGLRLENNTISSTTRACLFNSFNFDARRLRRLKRRGCRMVHRVDGPIAEYRGSEDGVDRRIWELNQELADRTIFQSDYSLRRQLELGFEFRSPEVILNASDPDIFHRKGKMAFDRGRKTRLVSVSWSDNPNKGASTYQWLERHLDWNRFDYTFVGRSPIPFERIRTLSSVGSEELAGLLRQHDIYITASRHDPCSNALIEALSCGLPAIYRDSGGHRQIAGEAGFPFSADEQIPDLLDRLVAEFEGRQARISVPSIAEVADRYLAAMLS